MHRTVVYAADLPSCLLVPLGVFSSGFITNTVIGTERFQCSAVVQLHQISCPVVKRCQTCVLQNAIVVLFCFWRVVEYLAQMCMIQTCISMRMFLAQMLLSVHFRSPLLKGCLEINCFGRIRCCLFIWKNYHDSWTFSFGFPFAISFT